MDMTAEEFLNKKYNGKGYSAKVHDWNKSTHHNIVLPNLLEEFASLKTKELEKQLQKEAMKQLSLLDWIKELEDGIEILKELCQLKKYKDEVGKDSFYQKRQPELWKLANEFLNKH